MIIRLAGPADLPLLQVIELAAAEPFRLLGMPEIADDDPPSLSHLQKFTDDGRCWVATESAKGAQGTDGNDLGEEPVAYLLASRVDGTAHIEQVSVIPTAARRGIGAALIDHLAVWAVEQGLSALTLTTFADVPWNAPYYARLGFRTLEAGEVGEELCAIRTMEKERGLDRWPRVCMRRELHKSN
ncbi:hypothetical protein AJ79_01809 [Helicocarpus griseus UAMH5409]|uniref:N-acetyltransferase domain-containing protein n=1 Tax=Helicocarpus griseus UAMH5409 TaxID=1447875 RepID=A0A2B7Y4W9_9EURO|nr:hypothetical protein AJ79_01809 [Helicocarpus griseus UAMH5409]